MDKKKIIIIGAGPAGLTTALELLRRTNEFDIEIIEELDQIGGISKTVNHNGNRMDIGGHRFFSKEQRVLDFWDSIMKVHGSLAYDDKKLGKDKPLNIGGPDPEKTDNVMLVRERVSRIYYLRNFFDYPVSLKLDTIKNMGLARTFITGLSYMKSMIIKRQEKSLEDFMINRFGKKLYGLFFEDYTEKVWGLHPSKISAEWGAQRIKGLDLSKALLNIIKKPFTNRNTVEQKGVETSLIERFKYPKLGPGQLWELVADEFISLGGKITMNSKVDRINIQNNIVESISSNNTLKKCDFLISSMPIKDLVIAINGLSIPADVFDTASTLPYRDFITVGLLVNKLNIKNTTSIKTLNNIIPDCWIYIQEPDVKIGRLQIFNNWSPYMVKEVDDKVWIGLEYFCNEGDELWKMTNEEFIDFSINELNKIGIINRNDVIDKVKINVKKAYPAYFGSYENFESVRQWLNNINNLFCIGRNGQHRYNNMDHSMMTGMVTADMLLSRVIDKELIWSINTDKDYHETKEG